MSGPERIDWQQLQTTFATGSPIIAIGPGCHRIGYDTTPEWRRVVERAGLVLRRLGEQGEEGETDARRAFLVRFWADKLFGEDESTRVEERGDGAAAAPAAVRPDLDIRSCGDGVQKHETARIALATDLLCGLVDATRLLGATIETGGVPVTDWQRVGVDPVRTDGPGDQLRRQAVRWLRAAADLANALDAVHRSVSGSPEHDVLAEHGLEIADAIGDKFHLLKVADIGASLEELIEKCFEAAPDQISGAVVEWLSDLFWHVMVSGAGVPPSEDELSFYLNLREMEYSNRRFSRPHPGEYRGRPDRGEKLRTDLANLLKDYDCGFEDRERSWRQPRERFARAMAASLLEIARTERSLPANRLVVALVSDYDLMLERAVMDRMEQGEAFHLVTPAVVDPQPSPGKGSLVWLYGTVEKERSGPGGRLDNPSWQWLDYVEPSSAVPPRGPIIIRLTGSPLLPSGTLAELELPEPDNSEHKVERLHPAAVFSEHDSARAVMTLTPPKPFGQQSASGLRGELFLDRGLTWHGRSWLFFGYRFSDWLPRLQLLITALMASSEGSFAIQQQPWRGQGPQKAPTSASTRKWIAVARDFDWPEQALLRALDIEMKTAGLNEVSSYVSACDAQPGSNNHTAEDRHIEDFLQRVKKTIGEEEEGDGAARTAAGEAPRVVMPKLFVSYSQEGRAEPWYSDVRKFVDTLVDDYGFEVGFDQHAKRLNRDWSIYGVSAVEEAEIVICMASPGYVDKWKEGFTSGASNEARAIREGLEAGSLKGILFVLLPGRSKEDLPGGMGSIQHETVKEIDREGLSGVVELLLDQPPELQPPWASEDGTSSGEDGRDGDDR